MFIYLNKAGAIGAFEGNARPILGSRRSRLVFPGALKREFPVEVKDFPLTEVQGAEFQAASGGFVREESGTSRAVEGSAGWHISDTL